MRPSGVPRLLAPVIEAARAPGWPARRRSLAGRHRHLHRPGRSGLRALRARLHLRVGAGVAVRHHRGRDRPHLQDDACDQLRRRRGGGCSGGDRPRSRARVPRQLRCGTSHRVGGGPGPRTTHRRGHAPVRCGAPAHRHRDDDRRGTEPGRPRFLHPRMARAECHQPGDDRHDTLAAPGVAHQQGAAAADGERDRRLRHRRPGDRRPRRLPAMDAARHRPARLGRECRQGAAPRHPCSPGECRGVGAGRPSRRAGDLRAGTAHRNAE